MDAKGPDRRRDAILAELSESFPDALRAEELDLVLRHLVALPAAVPPAELTADLVERLRPHVPEPRFRARMQERPQAARARGFTLLGAVGPQARLLGRRFWVATAVVGALLAAVAWWATADVGLAVVLGAPALAVAGVSFAFRGAGTGLWEAEQACPIDPVTLALARFVVVMGYDGLLVSAVTLGLRGAGMSAPVLAMLLSWLAPFLFLGTVAFFVAVRWGGVVASVTGMVVWGAFVWMHLGRPAGFDLLALPGTEAWLGGKLVLLAATGLCWLTLTQRRLWWSYLQVR